jgi:DNA polymerase-3 subunit delta'
MSSRFAADEFLGNERVISILRRSMERDRLPHALIFAGPSGVGKRKLALLLAQWLNCGSSPVERPCGECGSCRKIKLGTHPDVREVQPDGAFIKIDQVRAVNGEIAYQPFEARYRVVVFDGAELMRAEAANSLLKTLEEPVSRSIIILITANPYLLLETIRSRSRMLVFAAIPEARIREHLVQKHGKPPQEAALAAASCNGSLAAALAFDAGEFVKARADALRFVEQLLKHRSFMAVSSMIADAAKDKTRFQLWLQGVTGLLHDVYYADAAPGRMGQLDLKETLAQLARETPRPRVISALRAVQKLRIELQNNINRQIALESLFLSV